MTVAAAEHAPGHITWGSFNVFQYIPRMPGAALQVLYHLLGTQEPGGRCVWTQTALSDELGLERTQVSRGIQHLQFANLLSPVQRGIYQLNPMLSAYENPRDQLAAVKAMPREQRLDVPDFEERYQRRVAEHDARKGQRPRRAKITQLSERRLKAVD
ncbi:hypothetical protein [Streptacidiphilus neutrinimicus]|uniref:hypothetical protein n=1 Tax=Streptacidiphilus neutrinimicus TaxID=105420 RepID=UPI0005A6D575|nr:hypothetical protein [Streptacidiphilus neutrinimicus]